METKMITIPFEVELAKKIQYEEHPGKIVTNDGKDVRIVCWDRSTDDAYVIVGLLVLGKYEHTEYFKTNGVSYHQHSNFSDLVLQVPEWVKFKDGDIIAFSKYRNERATIFHVGIFKNISKVGEDILHENYVCYDRDCHELVFNETDCYLNSTHYATEEEKQLLINALKKSTDPRAKEYLKRFFGIEEKSKCEFQPFQQVLVKYDDGEPWEAAFYSHYDEERNQPYWVVGSSSYRYCIPYNEQTKHLLGTTDNWEE